MKAIKLLVLLSLLSGCAIAPPEETARVIFDNAHYEATWALRNNAKACWTREYSGLRDGISVNISPSNHGGILIQAARTAPDIGTRPPILVVAVNPAQDGSTLVALNEEKSACRFIDGCTDGTHLGQIEAWLDGKQWCLEQQVSKTGS